MKIILAVFTSVMMLLGGNWQTDFKKAQSQAKDEKKFILLNFSGSDWCGPCIKLKKDVLDTENFQKYAKQKLVLVNADFPRLKKNKLPSGQVSHNETLADKYNNKGKFPYTLLLDAEGNILAEWDGYPKDLTTIDMINQIDVFSK